jgi:hypothetical protein
MTMMPERKQDDDNDVRENEGGVVIIAERKTAMW